MSSEPLQQTDWFCCSSSRSDLRGCRHWHLKDRVQQGNPLLTANFLGTSMCLFGNPQTVGTPIICNALRLTRAGEQRVFAGLYLVLQKFGLRVAKGPLGSVPNGWISHLQSICHFHGDHHESCAGDQLEAPDILWRLACAKDLSGKLNTASANHHNEQNMVQVMNSTEA